MQQRLTHFTTWPDTTAERVHLLHAAGCSVDLIAETLDLRRFVVRQELAKLGLTEGAGPSLHYDEQCRALHAAGLGMNQITEVMGLRSINSTTRNFRRLGLKPNGWNARARRVQRKNTRQQVHDTVGYCNGKRNLNDLLHLDWRATAAKAGWAHLLDRVPELRPIQVKVLTFLWSTWEKRTEPTILEIAAAVGRKRADLLKFDSIKPLVQAGIVAQRFRRNPPGTGQHGLSLIYRLADGITPHQPESTRETSVEKRHGFIDRSKRITNRQWADA